MNEHIKELAEQAGLLGPTSRVGNAHEAAERFAELILEAERKEAAEHYLKIMRDAVKIEREGCAKLCDARADADGWEGWYADQCALAIRQRGEK